MARRLALGLRRIFLPGHGQKYFGGPRQFRGRAGSDPGHQRRKMIRSGTKLKKSGKIWNFAFWHFWHFLKFLKFSRIFCLGRIGKFRRARAQGLAGMGRSGQNGKKWRILKIGKSAKKFQKSSERVGSDRRQGAGAAKKIDPVRSRTKPKKSENFIFSKSSKKAGSEKMSRSSAK